MSVSPRIVGAGLGARECAFEAQAVPVAVGGVGRAQRLAGLSCLGCLWPLGSGCS